VSVVLDRARIEIGESLPQIIGALLLLVVGLVAARVIGIIVGRMLRAAGTDELAERLGVHRTLNRVGIDRPLSRLLRSITALLIGFVVLVASLSLLGLSAVDLALNEAILFLPRLLLALALVVAGIIVGELAGRSATRLAGQLALELPIGRTVEAIVIAFAVLTALAQIGVPTESSRRCWQSRSSPSRSSAHSHSDSVAETSQPNSAPAAMSTPAYRIGQKISIDDLTATIVALESAATVVQLTDGRTARVPNEKLLSSIVIVEPQPACADSVP
jgi:small-conductance mechanosensitive channel